MDRPNQKVHPIRQFDVLCFTLFHVVSLVHLSCLHFFYLPVIGLLVFLVPLVQDTVLAALVPVVDAHLESVGLPHVWLLFRFKEDTKNSNRKRTPLIHGETNQELWLIRFIIEAIFCKFSPPWHAYKSKHLKGRSGPRVGNVFGPNIPEVIRDPALVTFLDRTSLRSVGTPRW